MATSKRPRLAVWKFSSCDGCQLNLLNCEDQLLTIAEAVEIAYFLEATRAPIKGRYDISLVEGSVTTPEEAERIRKVRRRSRILVTIGACATAGGIQALRNFSDVDALVGMVYPHPEYIETLATSTPIQDHVAVDFELRGCPIDKGQLLELIGALVGGRRPNFPSHGQCLECKRAGTVCVMVARGDPCLGPVTQAGCGNLCPGWARGCYGCFGPKEMANTTALARRFADAGASSRRIQHLYRGFTATAEAFREEGDAHG